MKRSSILHRFLSSARILIPVVMSIAPLAFIQAGSTGSGMPILNLTPGGDNTAEFQGALDKGAGTLFIPAGTWKIGTVRIPADVTLVFDAKARLIPIPEKITDQRLLVVAGDRVRIEGIHYDFAWENETATPPRHPTNDQSAIVCSLVYAEAVNDVIVSGAHVENSTPRGIVPLEKRARRGRLLNPNGTNPGEKGHYRHDDYYLGQVILKSVNSSHITLENSSGMRLHSMLAASFSSDVTSRGNWMISGNTLTSFSMGGKNLRHHDNWSRDVKYQLSWFGGSPDPARKAPEVPLGSSTVALREVKPGDPRYNKHTSGSFDVMVQNNYAEYGNTLCWGNKGRQVIINGNVARFMADYAYGTEGGENVVFSNNISINSTSGGVVSMYWGEKLLVTGNLIIVRHEPWDPEWSWWNNEAKYLGPFLRLHHGPPNKEDRYGSGSVQITGNLFISELTQRSSMITIQRGRDVTISGNKFINGRIDKDDLGRLTVTNNEFVSRLSFEDRIINVKGRADTVLIKDNIMRREAAVDVGDEAQKMGENQAVPDLLFTDEDENARENGTETATTVKGNSPAIVFTPYASLFGLVQGNVISGWKDVISNQPAKNNRSPVSLIVTGNTSDGAINLGQVDDPLKFKIENNITIPAGTLPR